MQANTMLLFLFIFIFSSVNLRKKLTFFFQIVMLECNVIVTLFLCVCTYSNRLYNIACMVTVTIFVFISFNMNIVEYKYWCTTIQTKIQRYDFFGYIAQPQPQLTCEFALAHTSLHIRKLVPAMNALRTAFQGCGLVVIMIVSLHKTTMNRQEPRVFILFCLYRFF